MKVGDLVRPVKGNSLSQYMGVIWRVTKIIHDVQITITPVFALFGTNLLIANRQCNLQDVIVVDVVELGNEFAAFTQFIQNVVKQKSE